MTHNTGPHGFGVGTPVGDSLQRAAQQMGRTRAVERVQRIKNSSSGNPRYRITFTDGSVAKTKADAAFVYELPNDETMRHWPYRITFDTRGYIADMEPLRDVHRMCKHGDFARTACGACNRAWCGDCDPAPSALCHYCNGRGWTYAPRDWT